MNSRFLTPKWLVHVIVGVLMATTRPAFGSGLGDGDNDNDIDLRDFAGFQACFSGQMLASPMCDVFRFNVDPWIDLADYAAFSGSFLGPGVTPPVVTDAAVIVGKVFHAGTGEPLAGATVVANFYPRIPDEPPLPPSASTGLDGSFAYTTVPIQGQAVFLVKIFKDGFSEGLRQVTVQAGRCWAVSDAHLAPVNPPVMVMAAQGGMIEDEAAGITLEIPPGALMQDSNIAVTMLPSAAALRDELPESEVPVGIFVDISGVFGDETTMPVTMRVPNNFNGASLPLGTQIPFGKIDHNTLEWMDLTTAFGGDGSVGVGTVVPDPVRGTAIEVQFNHFCSVVCNSSGNCYPNSSGPSDGAGQEGEGNDGDDDQCGGGGGDGPTQSGNSTIDKRTGHMWEDIRLPTFREFGEPWGIRLVYYSAAADPSVTLRGDVLYNSGLSIAKTVFDFNIEGVKLQATYGASSNNEKHNASWIWNGRNVLGDLLSTGTYPYGVRATAFRPGTPVTVPTTYGGSEVTIFPNVVIPGLTPVRTRTLVDRAVLLNYTQSPYGVGWALADEHRLYLDPDGCVLLVSDASETRLYTPRANQPGQYDSDAGVFDTLTRNVGGMSPTYAFTRTMLDGTKYHFTPAGRLDRIESRYGYITQYTYTSDLLSGITSPTGYSFTLQYSGGKLSGISDSAGRQTLVTVNAAGNLVTTTDAVGSTRTFAYDATHRLISQTGPRGERSEYTYTSGRVTETRAYDVDSTTLLRTRQFQPSALNGEIGAALAAGQGTPANPIPPVFERKDVYIDGRGAQWVDTTSGDGKTITYRDPLNRTTIIQFDDNGLLVSRTRPNNAVFEFEYDADGNLIVQREVSDGATVTQSYEGPFGLISSVVDPLGVQTSFAYTPNGAVWQQSLGMSGNATTYEYADVGLADLWTTRTGPLGDVSQRTHDAHGNVLTETDPLQRTTQYGYDTAGFVASVTDPLQQTTSFTRDALGRIVAILDPAGTTIGMSYANDDCGCSAQNLAVVTFPNGTTLAFQYDGLDRPVQVLDQVGHVTSYAYEAEGSLLEWINRNGESVTLAYDAAGQAVHRNASTGEEVTIAYDALGNPVSITNNSALLSFAYDARGRVTTASQQFLAEPGSDVPHTVSYMYDLAGNRLQMDDVTGSYGYEYSDDLYRLTGLVAPGQQTWTFSYNALQLVESMRPNGARTAFTYDAASQVTEIRHQDASMSDLARLTYPQYSPTAQNTLQSLEFPGALWSRSFSYDVRGRLTGSLMSDVAGATLVQFTGVYDDANRLLSDGSFVYAYDAEGRLVSKQSLAEPLLSTYEYNAAGQLIRVQQIVQQPAPSLVLEAIYSYDGLDRRITRTVNGVFTAFVYDGANVLRELDVSGATRRTYITQAEQLLAVRDSASGTTQHCHSDHLGSIVALSDDTGGLSQTLLNDAFGDLLLSSGPALLPAFRFAGKQRDVESGLSYFRARYYDSNTGRFTSEDPLSLSGGQRNLYVYARNDPVNLIDRTGLQAGSNAFDPCANTCAHLRRQCQADRSTGWDCSPACENLQNCEQNCRERVECVRDIGRNAIVDLICGLLGLECPELPDNCP